jgi:hypothetical protein
MFFLLDSENQNSWFGGCMNGFITIFSLEVDTGPFKYHFTNYSTNQSQYQRNKRGDFLNGLWQTLVVEERGLLSQNYSVPAIRLFLLTSPNNSYASDVFLSQHACLIWQAPGFYWESSFPFTVQHIRAELNPSLKVPGITMWPIKTFHPLIW